MRPDRATDGWSAGSDELAGAGMAYFDGGRSMVCFNRDVGFRVVARFGTGQEASCSHVAVMMRRRRSQRRSKKSRLGVLTVLRRRGFSSVPTTIKPAPMLLPERVYSRYVHLLGIPQVIPGERTQPSSDRPAGIISTSAKSWPWWGVWGVLGGLF
jgi:hypothetical protein